MTPSQAAKILGCEVSASPEQIRQAFAAAVKANHPDSNRILHPSGDYYVYLSARYSMATLKQARDVLLQRPAQACGVCRGTGWQSVGMKRVRCVKGCDESS